MAGADRELLERAVSGDAEALRELLKLHGPRARNAIRGQIDRKTRSVLDEDDVMQVAYLEAFLHLPALAARDTDGFVAWLSRIAQHVLRDAIRGLNRQKRPPPGGRISVGGGPDSHAALVELLGVTTTAPSGVAARTEATRAVESALQELPADYARVVRLYDLEGQAASAVGEAMGRSVGAVLMLRSRAHQHLRRKLGSPSRFFSDEA